MLQSFHWLLKNNELCSKFFLSPTRYSMAWAHNTYVIRIRCTNHSEQVTNCCWQSHVHMCILTYMYTCSQVYTWFTQKYTHRLCFANSSIFIFYHSPTCLHPHHMHSEIDIEVQIKRKKIKQ